MEPMRRCFAKDSERNDLDFHPDSLHMPGFVCQGEGIGPCAMDLHVNTHNCFNQDYVCAQLHGPSTWVVLPSLPKGLGGLNTTGKVSLDVTRVLVSSIGYV